MVMEMVEWKNPILEILSLYLKNGYLDGMNIHMYNNVDVEFRY